MPVLLYCYIQKPSNKGRGERKRRKKKKGGEVSKAIAGLDVLDQHTHSKLQEMEQERQNIVLQVYITLNGLYLLLLGQLQKSKFSILLKTYLLRK